MLYRVLTNITFVQQPSKAWPKRTGTLIYDFCKEFTAESSWKTLTDKASVTLPRNIYITDQNGTVFSLGGTNINIGGFLNNSSTGPVFLRGDKCTIKWGYSYFDEKGNELSPMQTVFTGYVSQVTSKKPFVVMLEDNMYQLKQVQASGGKNNFFSGKTYTIESMLREMITNAGLPFTVNAASDTSVGDFVVQNETIAQVLGRLEKTFHFSSYFRDSELRCGSLVYIEQDAIDDGPKNFIFQQNIISDELDYKRKDDLVLSAVATNTIEEDAPGTTKDGHPKTKKKKLQVLVSFANGSASPSVFVASPTAKIPPNEGGERRTLHFLGATTTDQLAALAAAELQKYYYTGLRGKFVTFGMPFVRHGDNVTITDPVLPERNGVYKVKSVEYRGGVGGLRQTVELDYLIPDQITTQTTAST